MSDETVGVGSGAAARARLQIARELGYGRIDITNT